MYLNSLQYPPRLKSLINIEIVTYKKRYSVIYMLHHIHPVIIKHEKETHKISKTKCYMKSLETVLVQGQLLKIWHRMLIYHTTWICGP